MEDNLSIMLGIVCPDCRDFIDGAESEVGDVLECDNCGCEFEVMSMEPFKVMALSEEK